MKSVRLTILGYPGVGKSAITTRYMRSEWQDSYRPTIEERCTRDDIHFRRERVKLTVTDTMGQDELADFKDGYCVASDGCVAERSAIFGGNARCPHLLSDTCSS